MFTLANKVDPDEMLQNAAYHQGPHCFLRQKRYTEAEIHFNLEFKTCVLSIYTTDHPKYFVSIHKEESIRFIQWRMTVIHPYAHDVNCLLF